MTRTTMGRLLVDQALPEDLRDPDRVLDKKGIQSLLRTLAERHPDKYAEVSKKLSDIGRTVATEFGGYTFGLEHLRTSAVAKKYRAEIQQKMQHILGLEELGGKPVTPEMRKAMIVKMVGGYQQKQIDDVYAEAVKANNPLALQVVSGSRGNKMNLASLLGSDLLYSDHRDEVIPLPVLNSYSQGLSPIEYWAATYGARRGTMATKFATADAGFLCLSRGTLVRMGDFTSKTIEEIEVGDVVLGANATGRTFPVRVSAKFVNGVRDLYRFRFRYGKSRTRTVEVTATAQHKALTRHLRRRRVRPDPVLQKTVTVAPTPLGDCERRAVSFHSLVPPQGFDDTGYGENEPWAWFVGLLTGDGGLTTNHLGYSCGDPDFVQVVSVALADEGFRLTKKTGTEYEYTVADNVPAPGRRNRLRTRLDALGLLGLKAPEKFVPDAVRGWNNRSVAAYIRGVFDTDGGVATSNTDSMPFLRLGMTAPDVVNGVAALLAERFGIYGQVCRGNTIGREITAIPGKVYCAKHDVYSFTIADRQSVLRFAALVGFAAVVKQEKLMSLLEASATAEREDDFLFHYLDREYVGRGPTYDIEVDHPDHLFVLANGAIVSNSKQLNQVAHRLMVVDEDDPRDTSDRGLPVDTDDDDNEGALLARDVGPYKRDTVLSPKILKHLKGLGHDRLLVRSPLLGGSPDGGVYARDVGVRERGTLPGRGEMVGLTAAQALSEPLSQGQLSAKHSGGVAGQEKAVGGFAYINQLIQVPEKFKGGATHAEHDGTVSSVDPAPAGGHYVWVDDKRHYVPAGVPVTVKKGDAVEAGDVISEGFPHPAVVVEHKGIGEGKRYFVNAYRDAARAAGMKVNRRNVELLARGLINHVTLTDELGGHVPDDVLPYSTVEHVYEPRPDHARVRVGADAVGKYLEAPILHYSIGTKIRPSVLKELQHFNIGEVAVHPDPPPFTPRMIRGMYSLQHDPDWMTRMYGSGLKSSLLDAAHRGATSDELGTSFVPGLARAAEFGRVGTVRQPQPGAKPPAEGQPFGDPRRPSPPAAAPAPPAPAKPKKTGLLSGWFKGSADRGTAKPVAQIKQTAKPRHVRIAEQIRGVRMTKTAQQPQVDSTVRPNTGSSTAAPATTTRHVGGPAPAGPGGIAHGPTPALPASAFRAPPAAGGVAPADFWHTPPQPSPSAPPGQVHPARTGAGMLGPDDDPDQAAAFVHGNGFGGEFGQATRLGSLLDTSATAALTAGSAYVPGQYSGSGSDDLIGGDRSAGVTAAPPPVATPAPGMSGLEIARGVFGPGGLATGAAVSVAGRGLAAAAGRPLAGGVLGGVLKPLGRVIPGVSAALEVADAATMTPQESRQRFDDKVTGKLDVRLPFGIVFPGNSVHGYLADNFLSLGRNIRSMGTTLSDAATDLQQSRDDTGRAEWRAAASRAGALQSEGDDLDRLAARRPLSPQETARRAEIRAEAQRVRETALASANVGLSRFLFGNLGAANPATGHGDPARQFDEAAHRQRTRTSVVRSAGRLGEGERATAAVLGGTGTQAQQDAFEDWLAFTTGPGRSRGEPAAAVGGLSLPAPFPGSVDGRGDAHRTAAEQYIQRMTTLAADATARGRADVAERATAAAQATRTELAAWTERHALPGFPVPAPAGPPPPSPSLFPAAGPTTALDPALFRRFTTPARPDVYNPDN